MRVFWRRMDWGRKPDLEMKEWSCLDSWRFERFVEDRRGEINVIGSTFKGCFSRIRVLLGIWLKIVLAGLTHPHLEYIVIRAFEIWISDPNPRVMIRAVIWENSCSDSVGRLSFSMKPIMFVQVIASLVFIFLKKISAMFELLKLVYISRTEFINPRSDSNPILTT